MKNSGAAVRKIARVTIALTLLALATAVLDAARFTDDLQYTLQRAYQWYSLHPEREGQATSRERAELPGNRMSDPTPVTTSIVMNIAADEVQGTITLLAPRDSALVRKLERIGAMAEKDWETAGAVHDYFGHMTIGGEDIYSESPAFHIDVSDSARITMRFSDRLHNTNRDARLRLSIGAPEAMMSNHVSSVTVRAEGRQILSWSVAPTSQSPGAATFSGPAATLYPLRLTLTPPPQDRKPPGTIQDVVRELDRDYVDVFEPLLVGIVYAIPLMMLIALRRHSRITSLPRASQVVVASFLAIVLFVGIGAIRAILDALLLLANRIDPFLTRSIRSPLIVGAGTMSVLFVSYCWKELVRRSDEALHSSFAPLELARPRGQRVVLTLALAAFFAILAWMQPAVASGEKDYGIFTGRLFWFGAVTLILLLFATLAAMEIDSKPQRVAKHAATMTLFILLFLIARGLTWDSTALQTIFVLGFMAPFAWALVRLFWLVFTDTSFADVWDCWPLQRRILGWLAISFACLLLTRSAERYTSDFWLITSAAWQLAEPFLLLVTACLLFVLYRLAGTLDVLEDDERDAGIVLALTFFFLPARHWLYIPIVFAFGYLMLRRFLFIPLEKAETARERTPATILDFILIRDAERALVALRKKLTDDLSSDKITIDAYLEKSAEAETKINEQRKRVGWGAGSLGQRLPDGEDAPASILATGGSMPQWDRATTAAVCAFIAAIPWIAVFLRDVHLGRAPVEGFAWIALFSSAIRAIAQWPLHGFFFGYFYAHIRGRSGVSKSISFFLMLAAPVFAATALAMPADRAAWTTFMFWSLQLLIECLIVGLIAGDYETLRRSGLGWRHLLDIHNLGALVAWSSTLLVAIGAAATTALTPQVASLISWGIKMVFPEAPQPR